MAYMGDDLVDIPAMRLVGFAAASGLGRRAGRRARRRA
jgi:3-deoxy-D-manno-octulosonate 8-phosphate phosphatase KdsC-like HAD superfamily phosphatase